MNHWKTFLAITALTSLAITTQALSFQAATPTESENTTPRLIELVRIWSLSGAVSIAMPLFSGLGTRTTLLVQSGMPLSGTLLTSLRQAWMGLEYALLIGGIAALFLDYPKKVWLTSALLFGWVSMAGLRKYANISAPSPQSKFGKILKAFSSPIPPSAHKWFPIQMMLVGMIYFVALQGLGATAGFPEALVLATAAVITSLIVLVPNGLGVMDAILILAGSQANLELSQSVAFALMLRLSYLATSTVMWTGISAATHLSKHIQKR